MLSFVDQVVQSQQRMSPRHPWPGKSHHLADLLPVIGAVAVNWTVGAGGFFFTIGAALETTRCVLLESNALGARGRAGFMVGAAEDAYQSLYGATFAVDSTWFRPVHVMTIPGIILFWYVTLFCNGTTGRPR
jgi:hypothetical protein